jgi:hypothetical protein
MDREMYDRLEQVGACRIYTARDAGALVGYAAIMTSPRANHYRRVSWATQDSLYIAKDHRGPLTLRFLMYQDLNLKLDGFHIVYRHDTLCCPYGRLLQHIGYRLNDRGYIRDLRDAA